MRRLSVNELNNQIKSVVEGHFDLVEVEGEISQVTYHHTGHIYFSIKDEKSILNCVMWRSNTRNLKFRLESGLKVVISGGLSVYSPRGEYKLIAAKIEPSGVGDLQLAYEQLKRDLSQRGYFDKHKSLPKFPNKIAIITAVPSAALSDMLKIASKRWPLVKIDIYNSLMQGENAKFDIVNKIELADKNDYDVIILARGGGSLEDLWSFNTIEVAEAIFKTKTPFISAIGHEIDVMISDYVADIRASTPSNAMEILLPDMNEQNFIITDLISQFEYKITTILHKKIEQFNNLKKLYKINSIEAQFKMKFGELEKLKDELNNKMELFFKMKELEAPKKEQFNNRIENILSSKSIMLNHLNVKHFETEMKQFLNKKENNLKNMIEHYKLLNPENREKKGYVELIKDGQKIDLMDLKKGDKAQLNNTKRKIDIEVI